MIKIFLNVMGLCLIALSATAQNPYLPLWEYIPDGEPYVFTDPENPTKKRVYIYGSHDSRVTDYCGRELVVWSASVDSLTKWRYDGVVFKVDKNARGEYLSKDKSSDVLFAPDVAERIESDGSRTYYLYPNNQHDGRRGMVAKSKRPDGPFEVVNWNNEKPNETVGELEFDPAVFVDDDGRVYAYWGFKEPYMAELDPKTMATVIPGTVKANYINGYEKDGIYRFFEASSMRKIKDKYVLIYSRFTGEGEFGLPMSNYTLAYAYSNSPMGPFTYGGTIIDGRARDLNEKGQPVPTATHDGNTHGSICEINGKWWVFYHRQTGLDEYSRQAMVAPIEVSVTEGINGKVCISEGEYTSEGFNVNGLNPFKRYSAGIACYYTAPKPAEHEWPRFAYYGSYVKPLRFSGAENRKDVYSLDINHNPVVNNTAGSVVGYKYFNFDVTHEVDDLVLSMNVTPAGVDATIDIFVKSPYVSRGGRKIGSLQLTRKMKKEPQRLVADVKTLSEVSGKQALFFVINSSVKGRSVCEINDFAFQTR